MADEDDAVLARTRAELAERTGGVQQIGSDETAVVAEVQGRLLRLGYTLGPAGADGVFDGKTQAALKAFQADAHIDILPGKITPTTRVALVDATERLGG